LKQRVLTALVLFAVFCAALWAPMTAPFMALTWLMIAAAAWEWARLVGVQGWRAWASGVLCAALCLAAWAWLTLLLQPQIADMPPGVLFETAAMALSLVAGLLWIVGGAWLLWRGVAGWPKLPQWLRWGLGMVMLMAAWFVLVAVREAGVNLLLSVLFLVWAADTFAYFFGRALGGKLTGGRKLAPSISPGKSWEGAVGGFVGVLLTGAIWMWVDRTYQLPHSLYSILWQSGPLWFLGALSLLTAMSVVGDLTESLVKRAAGVKDSSNLLPGHGGVLDRIDALLPTLPLTMLLVTIAQGLS
jgi:phosphatidate cytidylyltransferase